jgi:transposase
VQKQLLPYEGACEVLEDLLGPSMSVGTMRALVEVCAEQLESMEQQIKAVHSCAQQLHQDETGLSVAGQRDFKHVGATEHLTQLSCSSQAGESGPGRHRHPGRFPGSECA